MIIPMFANFGGDATFNASHTLSQIIAALTEGPVKHKRNLVSYQQRL